MNEVKEKREKIITAINNLPDEKLIMIEEIIEQIENDEKHSIDHIYKRAVEKYHETLQKLAQ